MIENPDCPDFRDGEPSLGDAKTHLRFAKPPWLIVFSFDGGTLPNYSAKMWQMLSLHFSPDDDFTRQRLIELRRRLNWSRAMASAVLAAAEGSIAKWEAGTRSFSGPARRLINLIYFILLEPEKMRQGLDLIFWHRSDECIDFYQSLFDEQNSIPQRERMEKEETIEDGCPHSDSHRPQNQRKEELMELYNSSDDPDIQEQIASDLFKEFNIQMER